jgi:hypothetical protein
MIMSNAILKKVATLATTIALTVGCSVMPVSASLQYETGSFTKFSGFTEFPEGLTFQQVEEMDADEFLSLPNAQDIYNQLYELNIAPQIRGNYIQRGYYIYQYGLYLDEDAIVDDAVAEISEDGLYYSYDSYKSEYPGMSLSDTYEAAFEDYYGFPCSVNLSWAAEALSGNSALFLFDSTGLYSQSYRKAEWKEKRNALKKIQLTDGSLGGYYRVFNLKNTWIDIEGSNPADVDTVETASGYIQCVYDEDAFNLYVLSQAKSCYGYFYVFGDKVQFMNVAGGNIGGGSVSRVMGDANSDGQVNILDVVYLKKAISGKILYSTSYQGNSDVYQDNTVDDLDAEYLLRYLVGLEESLPVVPTK